MDQPRTKRTRMGGSFAPPLDLEKLARYRQLAESASPQIKDIMTKLCDMVEAHQRQGRSKLPGVPHPSGAGIMMVPLEEEAKKALDELVPWSEECDMYQKIFDGLDPGVASGPMEVLTTPDGRPFFKEKLNVTNPTAKEMRDACFHLLWYAKELTDDREPMTSDQLPRR